LQDLFILKSQLIIKFDNLNKNYQTLFAECQKTQYASENCKNLIKILKNYANNSNLINTNQIVELKKKETENKPLSLIEKPQNEKKENEANVSSQNLNEKKEAEAIIPLQKLSDVIKE
jgi:hypothetical protein